MRFSAPDRLNMKYIAFFALAVFVAQVIEGTEFAFAVLTATYTLLWASAFNTAGGIRYPSGAFIFFNGFLNAIIGLTFKVFLGQPGDSHLKTPDTTMFVYCVGMAAILVAAFMSRMLRPARGLLRGFDSIDAYKKASIVCLIGGAAITVVTMVSSSPFLSAIRQINTMPQLAIMLSTIYVIRSSNAKRSVNWIVVASVGFFFAIGLLSFGKTGMLMGFVAYFIAAMIEGYDFSIKQVMIGVLAFAFFAYYLVPYSQYVRVRRATTVAGNIDVALYYLGHLDQTRRDYYDDVAEIDVAENWRLYDEREGYMDRQVILPADDSLISFTAQGTIFGLTPTLVSYANVIPHFIWKNKPSLNTGNAYAHEIGGVVGDEDETTGIAFSATADAFHQEGWLGVLLLLPIDIFLFFILTDTVVGSARWAPWALISILDLARIGPEGGLSSLVYLLSFGLFGIVVISWILHHVATDSSRIFTRPELADVRIPQGL